MRAFVVCLLGLCLLSSALVSADPLDVGAVTAIETGSNAAVVGPANSGSPDNLQELVQRALGAVAGANWKMLGALVVLIAVSIFRTVAGKKWPALGKGTNAILVSIGIGAVAAVATHAANGLPWNGFAGFCAVLIAGVMQAAIASGLYSWGKEGLVKKDAPHVAKNDFAEDMVTTPNLRKPPLE